MQVITLAERRARLAVRHHLAPAARAKDVVDVARDVVCLHATDPSTVYLSAWARLKSPSIEAVDRALYEDRSLLRMLAMRRTMFVTPIDEAPLLHAGASLAIAKTERRRSEQLVALLKVKDPARWFRDACAAALVALEKKGEATAQELTRDVPALAKKVRVNVGKKYEAEVGFSGRVLLQLGLEGKVVRGRPRGSWLSSQYRWSPLTRWLGAQLEDVSVEDARTRLVARWLERFGPGTENDVAWWTGWPLRDVRPALAKVGEPVELEGGGAGWVARGDRQRTRRPAPWVALLPSLDPTVMGWKDRDWYLGPHQRALFDTSGNAGPTLWVDGRIAGGWAVRPDGEVVTKLLEDIGAERSREVDAEAERLTKFLNATGVTPRFPSPLSRELLRQ